MLSDTDREMLDTIEAQLLQLNEDFLLEDITERRRGMGLERRRILTMRRRGMGLGVRTCFSAGPTLNRY